MDSPTARVNAGSPASAPALAAPALEFEPVMEMHAVLREDVEA